MERLTDDRSYCEIIGCPWYANAKQGGCNSNVFGALCKGKELYERLRAYEQTELEPEEILPAKDAGMVAVCLIRQTELERLVPYERLFELAQADKEGRVVVRPCKVGNTINAFRWTEEKGHHIISDLVTSVITNKFGWTVKTKSKFYPIRERDGYDFAPISDYPYAFADFYVGSREDAEKALAERNGENG